MLDCIENRFWGYKVPTSAKRGFVTKIQTRRSTLTNRIVFYTGTEPIFERQRADRWNSV